MLQLTTSARSSLDNATGYLDQCFAPTVKRGIPFSSTHGNHDNANNINHQEEIEYEMAHYSALSYTRMDVGPAPWGVGNYCKFPIKPLVLLDNVYIAVPVFANQSDSTPALIMWFFDSRSFVSGTGDGPGTSDSLYFSLLDSFPRTCSCLSKLLLG